MYHTANNKIIIFDKQSLKFSKTKQKYVYKYSKKNETLVLERTEWKK